MGERVNAYVRECGDKQGVFIYGHWNGVRLPTVIKKALLMSKNDGRLTQAGYTTRIIFCQMMLDVGGTLDGTVSFGISHQPGGTEYPTVCVDLNKQTVGFAPNIDDMTPRPTVKWSIAEYLNLHDDTIMAAYNGMDV